MIALAALLAVLACEQDVSLVFGGDVALGRVVAGEVRAIGGTDPLAGVAGKLGAADLAIVNLEGALFDGPLPSGGIRLIAPTSAADTLARAGLDLVSIANNHALDAGREGLRVTLSALERVGIAAVGAPRDDTSASLLARDGVVLRAIRGLRIAFIAATDRLGPNARMVDLPLTGYLPSARLAEVLPARVRAIAQRDVADVIVVLLHWGLELAPRPTRAQRALAHALVDAGATIVVGHHPHVVHEVERHAHGVIFYSLGNLLFDMRDPRTRSGALARVTLDRRGALTGVEVLPTIAGDDHAPAFPLKADR